MQHDERELQCRCSIGRKDQQQHGCKGSCRTDVAMEVVGPWAAIHDATVQRMLGGEA